MKISSLLGPIVAISDYFQDVVAKKRAIRVIRPSTAIQQPSTQAILDRDPSLDEGHYNRPLADAAIDQEVDWSRWSMHDIMHVESTRRSVKNTVGQSHLASASSETRAMAVIAFLNAGNANLTAAEIETITQYFADSPTKDTTKAFEAIIERNLELIKS